MGDRFSYRPTYLARHKLTEAQKLFKLHNKNFSMNQLLNLVVVGKLNRYKLPKSLTAQNVKHMSKYSEGDRKKIDADFIKFTNDLNKNKRMFDGGFNNLNQITRKINQGQVQLDKNDLNNLKEDEKIIHTASKNIHQIEKRSTNLWLKI